MMNIATQTSHKMCGQYLDLVILLFSFIGNAKFMMQQQFRYTYLMKRLVFPDYFHKYKLAHW